MTSTPDSEADEIVELADGMIRYERVEEHISRIVLNRPDRANAILTPVMNHALAEAFAKANDDDAVKVVILTGAGRHFCGGEDVSRVPVETYAGEQADGGPSTRDRRLGQSERIRGIARLERMQIEEMLLGDKIVIAAVDGAAVGLGFRFALMSDIVVATDRAHFGRPQSRIGFASYDMLLPVLLLRLGLNRGMEALVTGRSIAAAELHDWGVVSSLVPPEDLSAESLRYARAVASHSTDGLAIGKVAMRMFWTSMGVQHYSTFNRVAHPLFTNLVWREDEQNFLKIRRESESSVDALRQVYKPWTDLGFD